MRWVYAFGGCASVVMGLGIFIAEAAPSQQQWWGWRLVWFAVALYLVAGGIFFVVHWAKDYAEKYENQVGPFYRGLNDAYSMWNQTRIIPRHRDAPNTCDELSRDCGRWITAFRHASADADNLLLEFADYVYPAASAAPSGIPRDRQGEFEPARESMADYLAEVAPKAKRWIWFRSWVRRRIRWRKHTARLHLALELALRRRLQPNAVDLQGSGLAEVPGLFKPSASDSGVDPRPPNESGDPEK